MIPWKTAMSRKSVYESAPLLPGPGVQACSTPFGIFQEPFRQYFLIEQKRYILKIGKRQNWIKSLSIIMETPRVATNLKHMTEL